ncbi:MAG: hypothetical protein ABIH23_19345 [bacterium]
MHPKKPKQSLVPCFVLLTAFLTLTFTSTSSGDEAKRLNNLASELLHRESFTAQDGDEIAFTNPRDGWIYVGLETAGSGGSVELSFEGKPILTAQNRSDAKSETMRLLPKGQHKLLVRSKDSPSAKSLVVRTMPETHFVRFPQEPRYPELGVFSWPWLKEHVLSSVNTVVGYPDKTEEAIDEWTNSGRKYISYGHLPQIESLTGIQAVDYWYKNPGFQDPRLSGMIADEFQGRQHPLYAAWTEGMHRLGERMRGTGKAFYAYCGGPGMYSRPETRELVRTVFNAAFYMAWERYHHEMPTLPEAEAFMDRLLGQEMRKWRATFPDCQKQIVLVLGIFATGPDLDVQPQANYKVWMDMQMRYLATHPEFDGLFGVHWWYSGAANEELLRWESALYRHYCINGATDLLSKRFGWTYMLPHVQNSDFYGDLEGWHPDPASAESLKTGYLERLARVQNRYWHRGEYPDDPAGNTYLWTKRQANRPNRVSQEIKNLVPGEIYTAQMITADYQDIINGRSEKKPHAVSLIVDGAELLETGSYRSVPVSGGSHPQLPFENGPAYFNHHRIMFRAKEKRAKLTISDWVSANEPGGPMGQELMYNYIQVQPYFVK